MPLRVDLLLEEGHLLFRPPPPLMSLAEIDLRIEDETLYPPPRLLSGLELPLQVNPLISDPLNSLEVAIVL